MQRESGLLERPKKYVSGNSLTGRVGRKVLFFSSSKTGENIRFLLIFLNFQYFSKSKTKFRVGGVFRPNMICMLAVPHIISILFFIFRMLTSLSFNLLLCCKHLLKSSLRDDCNKWSQHRIKLRLMEIFQKMYVTYSMYHHL